LSEVNLHYISDGEIEENIIENLKILVQTVKKYNRKVIVNSDAHNIWELGDDSALKKIKKKIGLTDNLIINNYPKELLKLLKIKNI
jgi:histidinol phosphatase-like PHP family hydrolase